jgi:hypothetical protein
MFRRVGWFISPDRGTDSSSEPLSGPQNSYGQSLFIEPLSMRRVAVCVRCRVVMFER